MGCMKHTCETVGESLCRPIGIQVTIVISLDASPRGDVIPAGGHLERSSLFQFPHTLHESLTEGPFPQEDSAVQILQSSCQYLGT